MLTNRISVQYFKKYVIENSFIKSDLKIHLINCLLQVSSKDMSDHILKLTIIDGGRQKKKSEIGHVTFLLKNLEIGDGTEQQLFKMDIKKVMSSI